MHFGVVVEPTCGRHQRIDVDRVRLIRSKVFEHLHVNVSTKVQ